MLVKFFGANGEKKQKLKHKTLSLKHHISLRLSTSRLRAVPHRSEWVRLLVKKLEWRFKIMCTKSQSNVKTPLKENILTKQQGSATQKLNGAQPDIKFCLLFWSVWARSWKLTVLALSTTDLSACSFSAEIKACASGQTVIIVGEHMKPENTSESSDVMFNEVDPKWKKSFYLQQHKETQG